MADLEDRTNLARALCRLDCDHGGKERRHDAPRNCRKYCPKYAWGEFLGKVDDLFNAASLFGYCIVLKKRRGAARNRRYETDTTPRRIQRRRTKGWRMPPNTVYVGRPTRWANVYRVAKPVHCGCRSVGECFHNLFLCETPAEAVEGFRHWLSLPNHRMAKEAPEKLRGKNLACWCPLDQPCHADVLLEIANS